jgi:hypothetical protein
MRSEPPKKKAKKEKPKIDPEKQDFLNYVGDLDAIQMQQE